MMIFNLKKIMALNSLESYNILANSILSLYAIFIILLNISIGYILLFKLNTKSAELKLILALCIVELIIGIDHFCLSICKFIFGYQFFERDSLQCQVFGFTMQTPVRIAVIINGLLALMRYLAFCQKIEKSTKFWVVLLILCSVPIIVIFLYSSITWNAQPTSSYSQCHGYLDTDDFSLTMLTIIAFHYLIPCWLTTICYFLIGLKINSQLTHLFDSKKELKTQKLKLILQLSIVFIVYNINFMPSYITLILKWSTGYRRTPSIDLLTLLLINLSIAVNPIIIISFQPAIHHEFLILLVLCKAKLKSYVRI
jgi:uncharacterized membrane protein YuzA (DUF378 family)